MSIKSRIIEMAGGMLVDILSDMITKEGVTSFRDTVIDTANKLADKTRTELDDRVVDFLVEEAFTVENYADYGKSLVAEATKYVTNSETKYDNYLLPILSAVDDALTSQ